MRRTGPFALVASAALLLLSGCAGYEKGNGLSRLDSKSFWYSGYEDEQIGNDSGASPDSSSSD
ncbi:MAG: hypothetical protein SFW64_02495 [Alphaproteobacteria bacterium]|nr:hypothetical protein [Alphaproteobacteria bacterium]